MLKFLWNTGARVGETVNIKMKDIDLPNNRIIIPSEIFKNAEEVLLLNRSVVEVVKEILANSNKNGDDKLLSWNETKEPNRFIKQAENNLEPKIVGRGLHSFRISY